MLSLGRTGLGLLREKTVLVILSLWAGRRVIESWALLPQSLGRVPTAGGGESPLPWGVAGAPFPALIVGFGNRS